MADDLDALVRSLRLREASALALERGDAGRAFELGVQAGDFERLGMAARALATSPDPDARERALRRARAFAVRWGDPAAEAVILEASGDTVQAAELYEQGAAWTAAANLHLRLGDLARAGRAFERHLSTHPHDADVSLALAGILVDAGRNESALRALARVGETGDGLRARAHAALGLVEGAENPLAAATPTDLLFGRYQVVREVASTPNSRVLEARDRLDQAHPRVALKVFTGIGHVGTGRDALARFRREMEILDKIDAPNVLRPKAFFTEGPTLVLPWVGGGTLEDAIGAGTRTAEGDATLRSAPTPRRSAEIVMRVLDALDAAHRRGVLHRDIKPSNVLLDEAGGVYLADFGVAHLDDGSSTVTVGLLGTFRYMSPEQRRGQPASRQSDLYAVGVILSELLGLPLEPTQYPSGLPEGLAPLLADLLATEPAERPSNARAVRDRMDRIVWPDAALAPSRARAPAASELFWDSAAMGPGRGEIPAPQRRFARDITADVWRDTLLGRDEWWIAPGDPRLPIALALVPLDHPAMPLVLGIEPRTGAIRVEAPVGEHRSALGAEDHTTIVAAIGRLHAQGLAHGEVATSVRATARGVTLAFPSSRSPRYEAPESLIKRDLDTLRRMLRL